MEFVHLYNGLVKMSVSKKLYLGKSLEDPHDCDLPGTMFQDCSNSPCDRAYVALILNRRNSFPLYSTPDSYKCCRSSFIYY